MREGWRLGCLWVWGWVRFFILCIFGVLIGAVWIGLRNELMRGWIKLRNFGDWTEKWAMWIGLRNGKGKLTVRGEDRLREGEDLKRLVWGRWWSLVCGSELGAWSSVCGLELGEHLLRWVRVRELKRKLFEVKMRTEIVLQPWSLILRSTLKIFSVWPNFPDQPNSLFYRKTFLKLVWSQNKHSLNQTADKRSWESILPEFRSVKTCSLTGWSKWISTCWAAIELQYSNSLIFAILSLYLVWTWFVLFQELIQN